MSDMRKIKQVMPSKPTIEGAGGRLKPAFGFNDVLLLDPFLLVSGKSINEPVAWHGPIVMNAERELERAFEEYRHGTSVKQHDAQPERTNAGEREGG
jgi:redox-sensitive bicupin YhaK (pirin superfamily)